MGLNQFSHLSPAEFEGLYFTSIFHRENHKDFVESDKKEVTPLREIDWQALGKISNVKDQGVCDAGYAFCSASLMESYYLFNNKTTSLSE
jgi:hypothetical protein